MRGIEAALNVLSSVNRKSPDQNRKSGKFAIEMLRKLAAQENMKSTDISLASSLIYISMRRRELWQKITADYLVKSNPEANFAKLPGFVRDCVVMGTGGLLELRRFSGGVLVNGILENLRARNFGKFTALVNAILHKVGELGAQKLEAIKEQLTNRRTRNVGRDSSLVIAGVAENLGQNRTESDLRLHDPATCVNTENFA